MTFKNILRKKYVIYIFLFILCIILFFSVYSTALSSVDEIELVSNELKEANKEEVELKNTNDTYKVDIKGAVKNPGIYELKEGGRIIDVINLSGGLNENADTNYINLSKKITDEMVIIIYTKEEIQSMSEGNTSIRYIDKECVCPSIKNDGCVDDNKITNKKEDNIENNNQSAPSIININTASLEQLKTLPGIGDSKAKDIINYRNQKPFTKIEDLKEVKGIGDATFEKLKSYITV